MRDFFRSEHREGFQGFVFPVEGRLPFPRTPIDSPFLDTREDAQDWAAAMIEHMHDRRGPRTIAYIRPFSGEVRVLNVETVSQPGRKPRS